MVKATGVEHQGKVKEGLDPKTATVEQCTTALREVFRSERLNRKIGGVEVSEKEGKIFVSVYPKDQLDWNRTSFHAQRGLIYGLLQGQTSKGEVDGFSDYHECLEYGDLSVLAKGINSLARKHGLLDKITSLELA